MDKSLLEELKAKCLIAAIQGYTSEGRSALEVVRNSVEIANMIFINEDGSFGFIAKYDDE